MDLNTGSNVTTRRSASSKKAKMALGEGRGDDLQINGSLYIDSILSQDETSDVISMFDMANELQGGFGLNSFCTSTQMVRASSGRLSLTTPLSPITPAWSRDVEGLSLNEDGYNAKVKGEERLESEVEMVRNEQNTALCENVDVRKDGEEKSPGRTGKGEEAIAFRDDSNVMKAAGDFSDGSSVVKDSGDVDPDGREVNDLAKSKHGLPEDGDVHIKSMEGRVDGERCPEGKNSDGDSTGSAEGERVSNDDEEEKQLEEESDEEGVEDDIIPTAEGVKLEDLSTKLTTMNSLLVLLDGRSTDMSSQMENLVTSLEFSQHEVDLLKKENVKLKERLDAFDTEEKRTQFQFKAVDDRMEKLETATKKKNLLFEGVPEREGVKENVEKTIYNVLDQLNINKTLNLEACYRVGPYNRSTPRPIVVQFEKQVDRDLVYTRRIDLRRSADFEKVWVNEDVGPASKRKRGLLRLISREAQQQGIDCRTGKYAIHINRTKFDDNNWGELPPQLQPMSLKQIQIDKDTVAYQSEYAPFSNFFPCDIKFGDHKFFCVEQAFQFVRAKSLNKPLAATRIFLSRDVHYIKQVGNDLGTSEAWEKRRFDVMYVCLMSKFGQNKDLRELLLKTGNLTLVEATPDRLWGCGATLSSNALRRHEWPGKNKHGETLMTVREELRRREKK